MKRFSQSHLFPTILAILTFVGVTCFFAGFIVLLNHLPIKQKILFHIRIQDLLVGMTIYLKTAIDFAIFIGNLMRRNADDKSRIAIQFGTGIGNGLGTCLILLVWTLFKEVPLLLIAMIILASLVLLHMAEESLEELLTKDTLSLKRIHRWVKIVKHILKTINKKSHIILRFIVPKSGGLMAKQLPFLPLLAFSMTIPFILGLDDFAGYIPLFSIVNVFGFATGVFFTHMLLTVTLFLSPKKTTHIVSHPLILLVGGLAFIFIALWGFWEAIHILLRL